MQQRLNRGVLIAIEGIDGSGKTTLAHRLYELLTTEHHLPVILTKEPGGSVLGKKIRDILQKQIVPLSPKAEFLLFAADRAEHFYKVILPNLHAHRVVISDRMSDSSISYQGYGRGLDVGILQMINSWTMNGIGPDLVIYLKIDPDLAQDRIMMRNQELTSFEQEQLAFTRGLIYGFETIFKNRKNVIILDGAKSADALAQEAQSYIMNWINENYLRI
jgi:dTMP kinase